MTSGRTGAVDAVAFARDVAPPVDRAFVAAMGAGRAGGGRELVLRYGPESVAGLIEFRPSLAVPGRVLTPGQVAAVFRYRAPADRVAWSAGLVAAGTLERVEGGVRATPAGLAFLHELTARLSVALAEFWPSAGTLVAPLSAAHDAVRAAGDSAFAAMTPAYLPPQPGAGLRVLALLSGLRYFRADAHAAAWSAAGRTAAEMVALPPGPDRDAIEAETNRLAAPPWAAVASPDLLDRLAALRHEG